jgi:hypothetical protein
VRFSKLTTMLAATAMAVTPIAATAQTPPPGPPPHAAAVRGPTITIVGVVLAVLIIALAIRAIGRPDRPISP